MVTDLVQIQRLGEKGRGENERLRKHLKRHPFAERRIRRLAEDVESQIDCRQCGNCCRVATVRLVERDIAQLARATGLKATEFLRQYTQETPDEGLILRRTTEGCVFLQGNLCGIYESRPHNCINFPHTVRGDGSFQSRMWDMVDRACYCPIVYNTLEVIKQETSFRG